MAEYVKEPKLKRSLLVREKSDSFGFDALSQTELVALILGYGVKGANVLDVARKVNKKITAHIEGQLSFAEFERELSHIKGMGDVKIKAILAVVMLLSRYVSTKRLTLNSPQKIIAQCQDMLSSKQERIVCFFLDASLRMIAKKTTFLGTSKSVLFSPRELFIEALRYKTSNIVIAHNHPSGNSDPSPQDMKETQKLFEISNLLGIPLLDHIIIANAGYYSFREKGALSLD